MTSIEDYYETTRGNTYVVAVVDGREVRWEAPGQFDDLAAIEAAVETEADMLVADSYQREYPRAVADPSPVETVRQAWERILLAGVDDAGQDLESCRMA